MTERMQTSLDSPKGDPRPRPFRLLVWTGPLLVFLGAVSYFVLFARYPTLRDFPWVNLPLVLLGLALSFIGLRRAFDPTRTALNKVMSGIGLLFSLAVTILFGAYIFYMSYQMPAANDAAQVGTAVPEFVLPDSDLSPVRLSDFRGQKVVVVFYRGHW